ncbi:beta-sandwich domain-containing protein [Bdellovibrio sp. HCB-110]|uniref:beta-sandwich domain-containing protein n=1 Tax=Bdellovibrio sp. HCB-110 TaxID=3391182 RepID=UPI0039B66CE8
MKLPILSALLVAVTLFQAPAFADIRPGIIKPDPRPGDRRDDRRDDRCDSYRRHDCRDDRRDDRDGRHGGYRPPVRPYDPPPRHPPYNPPRHEPAPPRPYPDYPDYPRNNYGEASVQFYGVTRRSGGEWLRVSFNYAAYVDYVRVDLYRAALQIHEAYAITQSGRRILIRDLSYAGVFYAGRVVTSEYITAGERIVAIDIRAESMGDYADVNISVISNDGTPSIYPSRY